ncbi:dual specificity phosphatase [Grosmannia clavigera kw1407]|uniref:protein-tyrosine-phosphatase n=1 Tax=Grosmannia clavigera (strain kw1407 / UAMH 11150) TaxID=655863 RepID=F0X7T1_GROCL|nr:dual specificity phosphatase [Grosmannia clavigera kw1407]EFX06605.1 dual specificity phosphatase [Grosmannia clavigera kw1407]
MPLDRIPGEDQLYIGSAFVLGQQKLLDTHNITHILSVLQCTPRDEPSGRKRQRLCVDVDDVEEEDLVVHFPRCVRFIDSGLQPSLQNGDAAGAVPAASTVGDVGDAAVDADKAVARALALVREARPMAEPNAGFMRQLALWWRMGCPADTDDAVERHPAYQRWAYQKDVQESVQLGRAPDRLWFGDEAQDTGAPVDIAGIAGGTDSSANTKPTGFQLRCKKCRRVLAEPPFIQAHEPTQPPVGNQGCPHYFVEPLSWMRPVLAEGALEGRLACPNTVCGALLGRYAWQGFQCSCRTWVCPAFSLQRSKVDQVVHASSQQGGAAAVAARFGIRLPPGSSSINNTRAAGGNPVRTENL